MSDEMAALAGEVRAYCQDAQGLESCSSWDDIDEWLSASATEAWHDYDNSLALRSAYGSDLEAVKRGLLLDYVGRNIARRFVSLRNLEDLEALRRRKAEGLIDEEQYWVENEELAQDHARVYERLGL
jgi:hypothetical protein